MATQLDERPNAAAATDRAGASGLRRPMRRRRRWRIAPGPVLLIVGAAAFTLVILIPVLAIFVRVLPQELFWQVAQRPVVVEALRLSLMTTILTLALSVILGTPLAYLLARKRFPGQTLLDSLIELPMVLPPAVAGIGLLMAFGRRGLFGPLLTSMGITIGFTTAAVVIAQFFVAAPFYVRAARSGFLGVDRELEHVSHTLGVSHWATFWRVTVPVALPSLLGGAVMCWARALGEFGATIMFAGSFQGRTQTMPLAIYGALESDLDAALVLSAILVVVSFAVLFGLRQIVGRRIATEV
ncbi:MAG: molybdate ABC transporter permease subunit [Chloroflexi bacterium]|nr:molybdate ABC transporter permease subunit [Chloroflexota bacterium]